MSFGRGRKDLEGLTSSYALEEEQRRASAGAARQHTPMEDTAEGTDDNGAGQPRSRGGLIAWLRQAFRR